MRPTLAAANGVSSPISESIAGRLRVRGIELGPLPEEALEDRFDRLDTALMALFRDTGDPDAFEALHGHARGRLFRWMRWLVRQHRVRHDPVDLLQDTFVNVYRYAKSFRSDGPASFRCWARTIAANVLRRSLSEGPRQALKSLPVGTDELADTRSGPQLRLVAGEETVFLRQAWILFLEHYARAFDSLSPRDRRALELVEVEGCSYAETGALIAVGPSNMKMIMLRARRRLQARMRRAMLLDRGVLVPEPPSSVGVATLPRPRVAARRATLRA